MIAVLRTLSSSSNLYPRFTHSYCHLEYVVVLAPSSAILSPPASCSRPPPPLPLPLPVLTRCFFIVLFSLTKSIHECHLAKHVLCGSPSTHIMVQCTRCTSRTCYCLLLLLPSHHCRHSVVVVVVDALKV